MRPIHHVFANRSNIGDWLSARGIQALLAPRPIVEHLCDDPFVPETLRALSALTPEDRIVIGGGGLFMDYFQRFWDGFAPIGRRVPYAVWGIGLCDLREESTRPATALMRTVARQSRLCVVRDELTRAALEGCDVPPPVVCPSMMVVDEAPVTERGLLHVANYTTVGAGAYARMVQIGNAFAGRTRRIYRETNNRIEPDREPELQERLVRYRRSDLVVSSALHGCIIAVAMGRPVVAVSGDGKIDAFMRAAGLSDWVLGLDQLDRLPERLDALETQPASRAFVDRVRADNRAVARQLGDTLLNVSP